MQLISIKNIVRTLLAGIAVALVANAPVAQAGFVVGSDAFSVASTTMDTNWVKTASVFNFSGITTSTPSNGDFTAVPSGTAVGVGTSTLTTPSTFTFGDTSFGTFTATSLVSDLASNSSRIIELLGTFTGGTAFPGKNGAADADLVIALTQAGGAGHSVSTSFTMVTSPAVPEPTSMALMGLGLVSVIGLSRFRRKSA